MDYKDDVYHLLGSFLAENHPKVQRAIQLVNMPLLLFCLLYVVVWMALFLWFREIFGTFVFYIMGVSYILCVVVSLYVSGLCKYWEKVRRETQKTT